MKSDSDYRKLLFKMVPKQKLCDVSTVEIIYYNESIVTPIPPILLESLT